MTVGGCPDFDGNAGLVAVEDVGVCACYTLHAVIRVLEELLLDYSFDLCYESLRVAVRVPTNFFLVKFDCLHQLLDSEV